MKSQLHLPQANIAVDIASEFNHIDHSLRPDPLRDFPFALTLRVKYHFQVAV